MLLGLRMWSLVRISGKQHENIHTSVDKRFSARSKMITKNFVRIQGIKKENL